jgi:hypothetical protein
MPFDADAEERRVRAAHASGGMESLNRLDAWRMRSYLQDDERRAHAQLERQAGAGTEVVVAGDMDARTQVAALAAEHEHLCATVDAVAAAAATITDALGERADRQGEAIRKLREENAELRVELAKAQTAGLAELQRNLVEAARLTIDAFNAAAAQRGEASERETALRAELAEVEARAVMLASELQKLKTHAEFKFAREDELDVPAFLPPPRQRH